MKVLLTGANGFLGQYLTLQLLERGHELIATGKGDCRQNLNGHKNFVYEPLDFTDPFAVHDIFSRWHPGVVIHAGAMSKPDACENDQWQAYLTNVEGTVTMILNSEEHKSFFLFVSTDFVFDGEKGMYKEDDDPNPVNFYGRTKLEAEELVKEYEYDWAIVRTVLVYGNPQGGRTNILTTVRDKLEKGEEYGVVDDQVRTPTYVGDLSAGIVSIIEKRAKGVYHISGKDLLTPYQMAIMAADHLGLNRSLIKKINSADLSHPAKRPPKTGFVIDKARRELGFEPVSFEEGLQRTFL